MREIKSKLENKPFKFNLQLFAEEESEETEETQPTADKNEEEETKSFTQEEVNEIIGERLGREKQSHKQAIKDAIAEAKAEWDKKQEQQRTLEDLSDEERKLKEFEIKEQELAEKEANLNREKLMIDTKNILVEESIPVEFAEFVIAADVEETKKNIDAFKEQWKEAINAEVTERLKSPSPRRGGGVGAAEQSFGKELAKSNVQNKKEHNFF